MEEVLKLDTSHMNLGILHLELLPMEIMGWSTHQQG